MEKGKGIWLLKRKMKNGKYYVCTKINEETDINQFINNVFGSTSNWQNSPFNSRTELLRLKEEHDANQFRFTKGRIYGPYKYGYLIDDGGGLFYLSGKECECFEEVDFEIDKEVLDFIHEKTRDPKNRIYSIEITPYTVLNGKVMVKARLLGFFGSKNVASIEAVDTDQMNVLKVLFKEARKHAMKNSNMFAALNGVYYVKQKRK